MKNNNKMKNSEKKNDYLMPLSAGIIGFIIIFCIVTIINSLHVNQKIHTMMDHPFPVVVAAGRVETRMGQMRMLANQLKLTKSDKGITNLFEDLKDLEKDMDEKIRIILEKGIYDLENGREMEKLYKEIKSKWDSYEILIKEGINTAEAASHYADEYLYPLFDDTQLKVNLIISSAEQNLYELEKMSESLYAQNIIAIISMLVIIMSLWFLFQKRLSQSRNELIKDSRLFNLISNGIDEVFVIRNVETGELEYVSENVERVLGVQAKSLIQNKEIFFSFIDPDEKEHVRRVLEEDVSQKIPHTRFHFRNPISGKHCTIVARIYYDFYSNKKRSDIIIFSDETMQVEMNEKLEQAVVAAQSANAAKSQFLSNMSHDIRTPMNAIIGMTAIAENYVNGNEKLKEYLNKISNASRHLLSLISDVLDMSKIESGKLVLAEDAFDLSELIQSFIAIIQQQIRSNHLNFDVLIKNVKNELVYGDSLRVNQILINIAGNAIKYTKEGGNVVITISQKDSRHEGYGCYEFIIKDNGIGMNEDTRNKLFMPFERAKNSTISGIEGTGLGMSIVKSILDLMDGEIEVESREGEGTQVIITLYLRLQKQETGEMVIENANSFHALVVDDDEDVAQNTSELLHELGVNNCFVMNGQDALSEVEQAHSRKYDFNTILVDWKMEGMDGLEVTRKIRQKIGVKVPIIVLTGYDWSEIEEEARAAGVTAFLSKPLFKGKLYRFLQEINEGSLGVCVTNKAVDKTDFSDKKILLVEDNAINMEIATELLSMTGVQVEQAWDGLEAIERLKEVSEEYYGMIFMDIQMPNMDGLTAARTIRGMEAKWLHTVPIIAMTANAFMDDIKKSLNAGMNKHITKPIESEELYQLLMQYLV